MEIWRGATETRRLTAVVVPALICILLVGCGGKLVAPEVSLPSVPPQLRPRIPATQQSQPTTAVPVPSLPPDGTPNKSVIGADQGQAYKELPEITVGGDTTLVASPSHRFSYVPAGAVHAGDRARVIGREQDGQWLLVVHDNVLGWLPSIFSRTGVGTLPTTLVDVSANPCTAFLGALPSGDNVWESTTGGSAVVQGMIYHLQPVKQVDPRIAIKVEGTGQASTVQLSRKPVATSGELLLFGARIDNLQKGSRIRFEFPGIAGDSLVFLAAFFSRDCSQQANAEGAQGTSPGGAAGQPGSPVQTSTPVVIVIERGPAAGSGPCRPASPTRLSVGSDAYVSVSAELNVRNRPGASDGISLGRLQPGSTVKVAAGPTCVDNMLWWRVEGSAGLTGWVSEGGADGYYLAPGTAAPASPPSPLPEAPPPASIASNRGALGQGQSGWVYQYEQGRNSGDFAELSNRRSYNGIDCFISPREDYVRICANGELHPGQAGRVAYRWNSSYSGPVTLQIHAHKIDTSGGDGIWIGAYVGETGRPPQKIGEFDIAGWDNNGVTRSYPSQLSANSYVLVMIDIRGQPEHDQSRVYIDILRR